jgi:colanic acid biosynthesis glycosyl transferase WcaI
VNTSLPVERRVAGAAAPNSQERAHTHSRGKVRILFAEQFYYPDGHGAAQLPVDVTTYLASAGFAVEVVCGSKPYAPLEGDPPPDPRSFGVRIRRVPTLLPGSVHRARLLRQLWFSVALIPRLFLRRPPDVFITQTAPPIAMILVGAAARLWRRPYVIISMDVYPDVLIAHGGSGSGVILGRMLAPAFAWAYHHARRVIALGPGMRARLEAKGVDAERIVEIPNWATGALGVVPAAENPLRREWELTDKFVLFYSGNLGLVHEFDTLLRGVRRALESVPSLRVVFVGGGQRLAEVRRLVDELGLTDITRFSDLLPPQRLPESFGVADLAVVTLRPEFAGLVVPSKLQGYMARGIPVLYIGPSSDAEQFIKSAAGGVCLAVNDVPGVAKTLIELAADPRRLRQFGENARHFYAREFARERGLARYERVIRSITAADHVATDVDCTTGTTEDRVPPTALTRRADARVGEAADQPGGNWPR